MVGLVAENGQWDLEWVVLVENSGGVLKRVSGGRKRAVEPGTGGAGGKQW